MGNAKKAIVESVVRRMSSVHSTSMHNAIQKLGKIPVSHRKGRNNVEKSIVHLIDVHNVKVTERMLEMLGKAAPSLFLMQKIAPSDL